MEITIHEFFRTYLMAILLGALMGLERERKENRLAGLRTFILLVLFGAIAGHISQITDNALIIAAGLLTVTIQSVMINVVRIKNDLQTGLTTAVALHVAFGIGILLALDFQTVAIALSLATTVILYFKPQMHEFSRRLDARDIHAIFQFGLLAFIILPVLPDSTYGPYGALNPYNIWLMVVMISGLNLVGYVTLKVVGKRWGGPFLGILGGLVSSTATTLSISRHAKVQKGFSSMGAVVIALASTVVLARIAILVGIIHAPLLKELALPLIAMFIGGMVPVLVIWRKTFREETPVPETDNPMELRQALVFGLLYAVILLAVSAGKDFFGQKGVYTVALISGLTDVDAITLSNSRLAGNGVLGLSQTAVSLIIAFVANLAFKLGIVGVTGNVKMMRLLAICFACLSLPAVVVLL